MAYNYRKLCEGFNVRTNDNNFIVGFLHYSADPDKNKAWVDDVKRSYPSVDIWNQEMELDFTKASGRRVFPEFRSDLHVSKLRPIPYRDIWRGWDFGYHHPACVWMQVDETDRLNILAELMGTETILQKFTDEVNLMSKKLFPGWDFKDAGDPAVRARSDKSERTSADILRYNGIRIQSKPMLIKDGINIVRSLLLPRSDGHIRMRVDETCVRIIEGFMGQYQRNDEDEPIKEGFYEHIMDALRYGVTMIFDPKTNTTFRAEHAYSRRRKTASVVAGY